LLLAPATTTIFTFLTSSTLATGSSLTLLSALISTSRLASLADGIRDDALGQVQVFPQKQNTGISQEIVIVLPGELLSDVSAGFQRLKGLDDLEIGDGDFIVGGSADVFFNDKDALLEQVLVDEFQIGLWYYHHLVANDRWIENGRCGLPMMMIKLPGWRSITFKRHFYSKTMIFFTFRSMRSAISFTVRNLVSNFNSLPSSMR
jgi:hypothetical protein